MTQRIAVFASGSGSNLQALLDHFNGPDGTERAVVSLVVSDRAQAGALDRARAAGVETRVVPVSGRPEAEVAAEILSALDAVGIRIVALAGYLRRVPVDVVRRYQGRMLNVHPALLPAFGGKGMYGLHVHRAVLAAGCRVTGPTVHLVDEQYDTGRIVMQWPVPVLPADTPESLAARVLEVEHRIYPLAVERLAHVLGEEGGEGSMPHRGAVAGRVAFGLLENGAPDEEEIRRFS